MTARDFVCKAASQLAKLIHRVQPVYPSLARQARVQGVVVLEAIVTKDGTVDGLRVLSGRPLLAQAALDAVRQWRYDPTLLNGEPVEVITTITVTFSFRTPRQVKQILGMIVSTLLT